MMNDEIEKKSLKKKKNQANPDKSLKPGLISQNCNL
jgi:hypothetical protein